MKTNSIICLILMLTLYACESEPVRDVSDDLQSSSLDQLYDHLDDSVLNSDWWNSKSTEIRNILAMELKSLGDDVSMKQIKDIQKQALSKVRGMNMRASVCPGFPIANPEGDVFLTTQAEVDAFGALNCKEITGVLDITDTTGTDPILDLSPLSNLKAVGSSCTINAQDLTSLEGLNKLTSVGELGPFGFIGLLGDNLVDTDALSGLKLITGSLNVIGCTSMTTLDQAFKKITRIEAGQTSNPLTTVGVVNIDQCPALTSIDGLSSIERSTRIYFRGCSSLADLNDLSSYNEVVEAIWLENNAILSDINALPDATTLDNFLVVRDNPVLSQCCEFFNLLCNDPPACTVSGVPVFIFNNNAPGCDEAGIIAGGACP